jgi:uncharacterized protein (TIGR02302 family)
MKHTPATALELKIDWQRRAMIWERVWQALHWPLMVLALTIIAVFSGLLLYLPDMVRFGVMALLALLFVVSLRDLFRTKWPTKFEVMRRLEETAGLTHRKISSSSEKLVDERQDDAARELWTEHKRRQLQGLDHVAVDPPKSAWRLFDPRALRVPAVLAALASVLLGTGNLGATLQPEPQAVALESVAPLTYDAWLKPPPYTGKPPVLLTSPAMREKIARGEDVSVPENAILTLRLVGANEPSLIFLSPAASTTEQTELKDITAKTQVKETAFTAEAKISRPTIIELRDGANTIASWRIVTIPDTPPTITVAKSTETVEGGGLRLEWSVKDDYGVGKVTTSIELSDTQEDGEGFSSNGPFLFDAPQMALALKKANTKQETAKTTKDLTAHPWAGLMVTLNATAKDAAGQEGKAEPVTFKLPEKIFTRPLAKALIEQRKRLILDPELASDVSELFQTILVYPRGLIDRSGIHIRLATIASALEAAGDTEAIKVSIQEIWQLALDIEDGSLSDAKAELRELKKQLEQALKNGASEEEIAKLMDKMREAMNRYLDSMRKEAQKNQKNQNGQQQNNQSEMLSREDLQRMLDQIEKMSKDGQKDTAQNLLDELDRMLQNLQPGGQQQQAGEGDPLGEMLDQLSDLMRQQQQLMDQTQRAPGEGEGEGEGQDGQEGQQGQNGQQPGDGQGQQPGGQGQNGMGQNGQGQNGMGGLADRQQALRDLLDRMQRELGGNAPQSFGDAGREMEGAAGSLRGKDREGALQQQGNALDQLKKGAGELSQMRRQQGQGQARNNGRDGPGGRNDDPLGRPRATRNPDEGPDKDMVPAEQQARRAREILEALRNRANEQGLSEQERKYIDRLLEGLY